MSMNLTKQTFSNTPEYFEAGTAIRIVTAVKEADAALEAHTPVLLGSNGKVTAVAAVDGTHPLSITGLYGITADSAESGEDAVIYLTGEFFADALVLPSGVAASDLEVAFRDLGIFLK